MTQKKTSKTLSAEELYDMAYDLYEKEDYAQAKPLFEQAAEMGYAPAFTMTGNLYYNGLGVPQDYKIAVAFYKKAAEKEDATAMENLGMCYYWGEGVDVDLEKSFFYSEQAAKKGNVTGMYDTGINYGRGIGVSPDLEKGIQWLKKAMGQGFVGAARELGCFYNYILDDYREALKYYEIDVSREDSMAMYLAGRMYEKGKGTKRNIQRALLLLKKAFDMFKTKATQENDALAQRMLGSFFFDGCPLIDIEKDYIQAVGWFQKAAEQGEPDATVQLGLCYDYGLGVDQNVELAYHWYSKGAEMKTLNALCNLGRLYFYGRGVQQDYTKAFIYDSEAAERGDVVSQIRLGEMYKNGLGVERNYSQAVHWFQRACEKEETYGFSNLAECYMHGLGVEKNEIVAVSLYQQGIDAGDLESRVELAQWYWETGLESKYSQAFDLLYSVCHEEEKYRKGNIAIRFLGEFCEYIDSTFDEEYQALYARAYFLLAKLYYTGKGVAKDANEAIRLLNMADRYGYKDPDNPEMTAKAAIEQIIKKEEEATIADTVNSYVEVRDERTRHGERYAIILHHADGRESELNIKGRNKLVYLLALMTTLRNDTKLRARLLTYHSKALLELVEDVNISTGNKSYKDWLNECSYQKSPKDKDRYDFKDGELISYVYDPRNYSLTKKKINTKIEKVCSENERQIFEIESKGNKEKSYMYLKCAPEQVHLPDSLQDFVDDLPSDDKVLKRNPIHEIKMPYYGE